MEVFVEVIDAEGEHHMAPLTRVDIEHRCADTPALFLAGEEKEREESDPCCVRMMHELGKRCNEHGKDCADVLIIKIGPRYALPIRDGGRSGIVIRHCPWCGKKV